MNGFKSLFLSLLILITTSLVVAFVGVIPIPTFEQASNNLQLEGRIIYQTEVLSKNILPPAPDIVDQCIHILEFNKNIFEDKKLICSSELNSYSFDMYFYNTQIDTNGNLIIRYWNRSSNTEEGLKIDLESGNVIGTVQVPIFQNEISQVNIFDEKLLDTWRVKDDERRSVGIYYQSGSEIIEVYSTKAPSSYYFFSLFWSPDGNNIVAIDSENNIILFSKTKEFSPVVLNNLIKINKQDTYETIQNILFWTN